MAEAISTPTTRRRRGISTRGQIIKCAGCATEIARRHSSHQFCDECSKQNKREIKRRWVERNRERRLAQVRAYNERNREEINRKFRERLALPETKARRRAIDLAYSAKPRRRLDQRMKTAIGQCLKGQKNGRSWEGLVGYSCDDLMRHLERQFLKGMSWSNIGDWHIDHIRPRASFSYESEQDDSFRECWSLSNLRPLWSEDNRSKSAKRLFLI